MKKIIISIVVVGIIFVSIIVSASVTTVINPIMSVYSILKVNLDKDEVYVLAQKRPWKVMIAKDSLGDKSAKDLLDEYMEDDGYYESDRMGSLITYKNDKGNERKIHLSVNKYYSLWEWV